MIYQQVANTFSTLLSVPVGFAYVFPQNYENQIDNQLVSTWGECYCVWKAFQGGSVGFSGRDVSLSEASGQFRSQIPE